MESPGPFATDCNGDISAHCAHNYNNNLALLEPLEVIHHIHSGKLEYLLSALNRTTNQYDICTNIASFHQLILHLAPEQATYVCLKGVISRGGMGVWGGGGGGRRGKWRIGRMG